MTHQLSITGKRIHAFTLIEIMISISIISIIILIGVTNFNIYEQRKAVFNAKEALLITADQLNAYHNKHYQLPEQLIQNTKLINANNQWFTEKLYYQISYEKQGHHFMLQAQWQKDNFVDCYQLQLFSSGYQGAYNTEGQPQLQCW